MLRRTLLARPRGSITRPNVISYRAQSTETASSIPSDLPPPPPLLTRLRTDLKTAMRSKDAVRLSVLKGVLADVTNVSKASPKSISTDLGILQILRSRTTASKQASDSFEQGGRVDLKENEDAQISVLEEYAGKVDTLTDEDLREAVGSVVEEMSSAEGKLRKGEVMKMLLGPGGRLEGKPVEKAKVAELVNLCIGA